jgi:hypothetical protein
MGREHAPKWIQEGFANPKATDKAGRLKFEYAKGNAFQNEEIDYNEAKKNRLNGDRNAKRNLDRVVVEKGKPCGVNYPKQSHRRDPWTGKTATPGVHVKEYYLDNLKLRVIKRSANNGNSVQWFLAVHWSESEFDYYYLANIPPRPTLVAARSATRAGSLPANDYDEEEVELNFRALTASVDLPAIGGGEPVEVSFVPEDWMDLPEAQD